MVLAPMPPFRISLSVRFSEVTPLWSRMAEMPSVDKLRSNPKICFIF